MTLTMARTDLTPRQRECYLLLAEGCSYREVAVRMGISYHGVNQLVRAAHARLGVASRTDAFRVLGWLDPAISSRDGGAG